jgi:nicotinamidase-related amidase
MPSEETEQTYDRAGLGNQIGYGDRPAVIVVDLQKGFTDPESPIGGDLSSQVAASNRLIRAARGSNVPVTFTQVGSRHPEGADFGVWREKVDSLDILQHGTRWVEFDDDLEVEPTDYVVEKRQASGFHETTMNSLLTQWSIDTVVVTGCSTSGCVRATVVDAMANGYRPVVAEGAVGDRVPEPHESNLFDMNEKYADVRPVDEVVSYLESVDPVV